MSNNKNYQEITEKRKATIQKKRDAKLAKKQVILDKINNDIEYLNKVKRAVEKRKDTISKKEFIKDLFNAGAAFGEEKEKFIILIQFKLKERREKEREPH